jgi:hypothetical protein
MSGPVARIAHRTVTDGHRCAAPPHRRTAAPPHRRTAAPLAAAPRPPHRRTVTRQQVAFLSGMIPWVMSSGFVATGAPAADVDVAASATEVDVDVDVVLVDVVEVVVALTVEVVVEAIGPAPIVVVVTEVVVVAGVVVVVGEVLVEVSTTCSGAAASAAVPRKMSRIAVMLAPPTCGMSTELPLIVVPFAWIWYVLIAVGAISRSSPANDSMSSSENPWSNTM